MNGIGSSTLPDACPRHKHGCPPTCGWLAADTESKFARAWAAYQAGAQAVVQHEGQGGWGGHSLTKEESEELTRSSEATRKRAVLVRVADHYARVEK